MGEEKSPSVKAGEYRQKRLDLESAYSAYSDIMTYDQKIANIEEQQELIKQEAIYRYKDNQEYDDVMELLGGRRTYGTKRSKELDELMGESREKRQIQETPPLEPVDLAEEEDWIEDEDDEIEFNEDEFADLWEDEE